MVLLVAVSSCAPKFTRLNKTFDLEGHRGCRGLMPENTIPAMLRALDLNVNTLEMDAVITADGQVILSHEPFFNHEITTKPDGKPVTAAEEKQLNIYKMTYAQTMGYDVGLRPHARFPQQQKMKVTKPKLSAVIDSIQAYCNKNGIEIPFFNIETKSNKATDGLYHPAPDEFVDVLMNVIHFKLLEQKTIIQSFDPRTLQYLHKKWPAIKTALLIEDYDKRPLTEQLAALGFTPTIYSPAYQLVTAELIKQCHGINMQVIPWTVNDVAEMKRLKLMGVDGLITDYPNLKF